MSMSPSEESEDDETRGEILKASEPGQAQITVGMEVETLDGQSIGTVKEIREEEFLLDRRLARDLWVPLKFVLATEDYTANYHGPVERDRVVLSVSSAHVDSQGWRHA